MKTIGIIGGGQLGRMMTQAAKKMGFHVIVLDPVGISSQRTNKIIVNHLFIVGYDLFMQLILAAKFVFRCALV